jgi:hypothetical protein
MLDKLNPDDSGGGPVAQGAGASPSPPAIVCARGRPLAPRLGLVFYKHTHPFAAPPRPPPGARSRHRAVLRRLGHAQEARPLGQRRPGGREGGRAQPRHRGVYQLPGAPGGAQGGRRGRDRRQSGGARERGASWAAELRTILYSLCFASHPTPPHLTPPHATKPDAPATGRPGRGHVRPPQVQGMRRRGARHHREPHRRAHRRARSLGSRAADYSTLQGASKPGLLPFFRLPQCAACPHGPAKVLNLQPQTPTPQTPR